MSSIDSTVTGQPARTDGGQPFLAPVIGLGIYLAAVVLGLILGRGGEGDQGFAEWVVTLVIALAGVAVASWAVGRADRRGSAGRTALILGVVAVLTIVVFWAGFPCVFGASAIALGMRARRQEGSPGVATAGILLGVLALAAGAFVMVIG